MMDVTKMWTWDYVKRELPKIPHSVPAVLVMANFIDQSHHRAVTRDQVTGFIEETMEEKGGVQVASLTTQFSFYVLQQLCTIRSRNTVWLFLGCKNLAKNEEQACFVVLKMICAL